MKTFEIRDQLALTPISFVILEQIPQQAICKAPQSRKGRVITNWAWWTTNHVSPIEFPFT